MRSSKSTLQLVLFLMIAIAVKAPVCLAEPAEEKPKSEKLAVELGVDVATGRYGTGASTTTIAVPLSIMYFPTRSLDLGLSVAYLRQNNRSVVQGKVVRNAGGQRNTGTTSTMTAAQSGAGTGSGSGNGTAGGTGSGTAGKTGAGSSGSGNSTAGSGTGSTAGAGGQTMSTQMTTASSQPATTSSGAVSGFGDLFLTAGYTVWPEGELWPQVRPVLTVKFPTAGTDLGTGEFDETFGLALTKTVDRWYLFTDAGYTIQGRTTLFSARNFGAYQAGVGYEVLPGMRPSLAVAGSTSMEAGSPGTLQLEAKLIYVMGRSLDLKASVSRGFSSSSPDWEGGCYLGYNF